MLSIDLAFVRRCFDPASGADDQEVYRLFDIATDATDATDAITSIDGAEYMAAA